MRDQQLANAHRIIDCVKALWRISRAVKVVTANVFPPLGSDIQTKTGFAIADATLLATTLYASFIYSTFKALFCIYE